MNHLITLFKPWMFIHLSTNYHRADWWQRFMQFHTKKTIFSAYVYINQRIGASFTFCSSCQMDRKFGNVSEPTTCFRVQGESGLHGVTLQATPGHIWTGEGSPALTPTHLELTQSETATRCINNTRTCTVCSSWEIHKGRQACTSTPQNKHCAHMCIWKTKCMLNHVITHTHTRDAAGLSCHLMSCEPAFLFYVWKETCVLSHCLREKYEQVLQLFEGHVNLPEEPTNSAGQDIPN